VKLVKPRILATAAATLATILGAGFIAQAAVLGRASSTQQLIVKAISKIEQYHSSQAALTINGKHVTAECKQHWGTHGHVETATLSDGHTFTKIGDKLVQTGTLAVDEFELVGCPRTLTGWLINQLNQGRHIDLTSTTVNDKPAYALHVPSALIPLDLYLTRPGGLPIKLALTAPGIQGTSEVKLGTTPSSVATQRVRRPPASPGDPGDAQQLRTLDR